MGSWGLRHSSPPAPTFSGLRLHILCVSSLFAQLPPLLGSACIFHSQSVIKPSSIRALLPPWAPIHFPSESKLQLILPALFFLHIPSFKEGQMPPCDWQTLAQAAFGFDQFCNDEQWWSFHSQSDPLWTINDMLMVCILCTSCWILHELFPRSSLFLIKTCT